MTEYLTNDDMCKILMARVDSAGSIVKLAPILNVTPQAISKVLCQTYIMSAMMAETLGYTAERVYFKKESQNE